MRLRATERRAIARTMRAICLPAMLVMLDTVTGYLQAGVLEIDWKVVAVAGVTALAMGVSKWLRDEIGKDIKVA